MKNTFFLILILAVSSCNGGRVDENRNLSTPEVDIQHRLTVDEANRLAELPLKCIGTEYPNKLNQTLNNPSEAGEPSELHPAFYGCFDWHSSVHGHWMLIRLLKEFPDLEKEDLIRTRLADNISTENILKEVEYFQRESEKSFERTYGWAWLLKLSQELADWDDPLAARLSESLQPLTDIIVERYMDFLPKLLYPVRVGEHPNTAFGLAFAWDYALAAGDTTFSSLIKNYSIQYFGEDNGCPYTWEPGGYDFLSPCLEEADLMRRILPPDEFTVWLKNFMPDLFDPAFYLEPARVTDRTDGKLVHLDGLNFSRAWCLYGLASQDDDLAHLAEVADNHLAFSLESVVDGSYAGEHWLASFAVYALSQAQ
ncbi:MAG: DUF2891 domain-containing protein [Bacteroidales bacterium]|nr:DUF2891 domain-containing protein [Bacteroidales bacterium]